MTLDSKRIARPSLLMLGGLVLIAVFVAACFERTSLAPCPSGAPYLVNDVCFSMPPDGFVAPPDMAVVTCSSSMMCPASTPICGPTQQCVGCAPMGASADCSSVHPMTPLCGPNGGCVECLTKDNCDAKHQTCDAMNACGPCKANTDCMSGLCNVSTGVCADKSTLLYVNNATGAGCNDAGSGSYATPFCTVQRGLNASAGAGKQVIVFAGQGYTDAIAVSPTTDYVASAIGVGGPVLKPTGSMQVLSLKGSSTKMLNVTIDSFVIDGSLLTGTTDAVKCDGGGAAFGAAIVTIVRSTIKSAPGYGLYAAAQITMNMDADTIRDNKSGGFRFDAADFTLTNLLVLSNGTPTGATAGSAAGAILVSAVGETGKMNLANLTMLGNKVDSGVSGTAIQCPPSATANVKTINSVLFGNTGGSAEIQSNCVGTALTPLMTYSAYAGGSAMLNNEDVSTCAASLLFTDPANGDYTPKKGNAAPCTLVDQGTNATAPDHDFKGTPRPQPAVGGKWDIGAIEAL